MINTTSAGKFYETYHNYFITNININNNLSTKNYKYIFFSRVNEEIYCLEGSSMEEIYYKILFKIDYNCCDDIYCYEYPLDILKNPIELLKSHYFDTDNYIFKEANFITSGLNEALINPKVKINTNNSIDFYETFRQYYLSKVSFKATSTKYQYVLINNECGEVFLVEGYSMEELYYIIFFKIDSQLWDNIFDTGYPMKELKNPLKLFKTHYLESNNYIFTSITFE